jgi:hypothetical protein
MAVVMPQKTNALNTFRYPRAYAQGSPARLDFNERNPTIWCTLFRQDRNSLVSEGKSKAVPIDEPDKIEEFVEIFGKNRPNTDLEVDTTSTDTIDSVNTIIKYLEK